MVTDSSMVASFQILEVIPVRHASCHCDENPVPVFLIYLKKSGKTQ